MPTLVTGGCGFIGANLVPMLLEDGRDLRVLDNLVVGDPGRLPAEVELVEGDIRDRETVRAAMDDVHTVVHLAAAGSVAESVADPQMNFSVNALGTLNMLQESAAAGVARFVFASTGGALIGDAPPPVNEQSLPKPISPYGASKLCCEAYLSAFRGSYGLNTVGLRFANVYGPLSERKKGAVTTFIKSALEGRPIRIFGDGNASRDFLYVDDLCAGIRAAVERPEVGDVVHLASERETTVRELAELIIATTGAEVPIELVERRAGEVERNFATADRAREVLDFRPAYTLESGMAATVDWFRETRAMWETAAPA